MDLTLRSTSNSSELKLAPTLGSAWLAWRVSGRDILRPTPARARAQARIEDCASWPLIPWSNRIANGRFRWLGREIQLPVDARNPHAIHGLGWRSAWAWEQHSAGRACLRLDHDGDERWPFAFQAEQHLELSSDPARGGESLQLKLRLQNTGTLPMPAGLGIHPYFVCKPGMLLQFRAREQWDHDADCLPTRRRALTADCDFSSPREVWGLDLDRAFVGWDGAARLIDPEHGFELRLSADPLFSRLVVYVPPGEDAVAIEPVTHDTNAVNAMGESGLVELGAGQCLEGRLSIEVVTPS